MFWQHLSAKDTDGLDGLHGVLKLHDAHTAAAAVLIRLQLSSNHVARHLENFMELILCNYIVQLKTEK